MKVAAQYDTNKYGVYYILNWSNILIEISTYEEHDIQSHANL